LQPLDLARDAAELAGGVDLDLDLVARDRLELLLERFLLVMQRVVDRRPAELDDLLRLRAGRKRERRGGGRDRQTKATE
jgi:hypothetical protein